MARLTPRRERPELGTLKILETHNWDEAARFFQALGFELEFATGERTSWQMSSSRPTRRQIAGLAPGSTLALTFLLPAGLLEDDGLRPSIGEYLLVAGVRW